MGVFEKILVYTLARLAGDIFQHMFILIIFKYSSIVWENSSELGIKANYIRDIQFK